MSSTPILLALPLLAVLPFVYLVAFAFDVAATGYIVVVVVNFVTGAVF